MNKQLVALLAISIILVLAIGLISPLAPDKEAAQLGLKRFIGKISQLLWPNYSFCGRCWRVWAIVRGHCTEYVVEGAGSGGCFPLCESCWHALTIEERMSYYENLIQQWKNDPLPVGVKFDPIVRAAELAWREEKIKAAVLAGR